MADDNGNCLWHKFEHLLPLPILLRIATAGCPMEEFSVYSECCKGSVQGVFAVKSTYAIRCGPTVPEDGKLWTTLHKYRGLQRIKTLLWLACLGRVLTNSERVRRHISDNAGCILYGALTEDVNHLLRWCPQSQVAAALSTGVVYCLILRIGTCCLLLHRWFRLCALDLVGSPSLIC
ncbi:hypothetical protein V6N13_111011 [Hibiscus sabdariffa]